MQVPWLSDLFEVFTPRIACMNREPDVILVHFFSDAGIAAAYFAIPLALLHFARRRPDVGFTPVFRLFAAFIVACGTTHLFNLLALWQPLYRVDGVVKLWTAVVSLATAYHVFRLLPVALAIPSPAQLREVNDRLTREVEERRNAEAALKKLADELEGRVAERTAELERLYGALRLEIQQREAAEADKARLLSAEQNARAAAERANRTKDEFLATLSHELRTPLNAILGWSQVLARVPDTDRARGLSAIERNARAQARLVDDLLDMSAISAGKLSMRHGVVALDGVAKNALETIRPNAQAKGISMRAEIAADLPPVVGDGARLEQVIWNLLSNAVKFTPSGGHVWLAVRAVEGHVEIEVRDDGIGIDPAFRPFLFERFRQADSSATRQHGGLGLGLAIVRHVVAQHGGTVHAESEGTAKGARFVVRLPVTAKVEPSAAASRALPDIRGLRVLVVDDDPDQLDIVTRILRAHQADVTPAASVALARERLTAGGYDIVVSDLSMPGESGYELVQWLRRSDAANSAVPAIALTALARTEDQERALGAGFAAHIAKPVGERELITLIGDVRQRAS